MRIARWLSVVASIAFALMAQTTARKAGPQDRLWIAIGVPQPLYSLGQVAKLQVAFVVVNDGDAVVDPGIGESRLFVNDVEPGDWTFVINNGLVSSDFKALAPGNVLAFGYQLGDRYFGKPGIYRVRWQVGSFRSTEITFRVQGA